MSESGIIYEEGDTSTRFEKTGEFPFRRGIHTDMYVEKLWTMRQYSGFGSAEESNIRFKKLIAAGATGISIAFDLPTQHGLDSDHVMAQGEVGKVGVPVSTLDDMRQLLEGIPLEKISTSMTINAPAAILTAMYEIVANERGIPSNLLSGTSQNDILKEYISRGTYIYPPVESIRLFADLVEYCTTNMPNWNSVSISGYHMSEAGATPVQEIAFTFANARAYINALLKRGMEIDDFAPHLSFFFSARENILEQICKFRVAREIWAEMLTTEFGAQKEKSSQLRLHAQTAGVELTAQNPELNIVRVTIQALGAIFGGAQSLHTNSYDEAISLPSEFAVGIALSTQKIMAFETDVANCPDPFGGSYAIESMTDKMKTEIIRAMDDIEEQGGAVKCIEENYQRMLIETNAYRIALEKDYDKSINMTSNQDYLKSDKQKLVTGQNYNEETRCSSLSSYRINRDCEALKLSLENLSIAVASGVNLIPFIQKSLLSKATIGEISNTIKLKFGTFRAPDNF